MGKRSNPGSTWQLLAFVIIAQLFWCRSLLWGLDPNKPIDLYLVDQWEMVDGLSSNTVRSITQTPDGYLWIGTSRGLVRFDGMKFGRVRFAEKEEIYSQEIRHLLVDREGCLWIGSAGGLTLYQYKTGQFNTFTKNHGITVDGIRRIKEDMKGNTWISFTASYVNRFSNGEFFAYDASHGLIGKKINAIIEDRQGNLLFGTRENGIFIYKDGTFFKYPLPGLDNVFIIAMYEDWKGDLWIGTNKGLFRVTDRKIKKYTVRDGLSTNYITSLTEDSDRNLWVGTIKGLNRVKKTQDGAVGFESCLNFLIYSLFEDREKSLWIGTNNSGIIRLKDGKFISYAPLDTHLDEIPFSLFEDRHGDTWIGTVSGKLFHCRGSEIIESITPAGLSGTGIAAIAEDGQGNLWLGTIGEGVFKKKNRTFTQFTTREGLADNLVTSIFRDSHDNLWFSTFDGVSVRHSYTNIIESLKARDGLSGKVVHNVYEVKAGDIWIATDKGITILKKVFARSRNEGSDFFKKSPWSPKAILSGVSVTCIYEDVNSSALTDSIFWIATQGAGLKRLQYEKFFSYTTPDGMTTNVIYQFLEDQQGNFWLMSDSGILRVSKSELNTYANGSVNRINCTSFGIPDGMKSLEFNNACSGNSVLKARNGEFRFITKRGISIVNPAKIRINKTPSPVVIEAVFFNDQPLPFHHVSNAEPVTGRGITNASFHFTAPTFLSPGKINFKYQLQGFDRGWIFLPAGNERAARYKNLAPGTYTFRVTACNAEGVWNQTGNSLTFTLKPLFYQTFLFKIAVLFLFFVLLAAAFYFYKKRPFKKKAKYKGSPLHPHFAGECTRKLKHLMENEKVYSDADISLQSLAEQLSISPHQLSQLLNEKLDRNFPDFINSYRIKEAKRILKSPKGAQQKIDSVAFEVGFNTSVAFYRAFKKHTNITPTQYKKEVEMKK
jgi:ligand-binding sensor domain-containing protein/AraC-like DNA-binding protein